MSDSPVVIDGYTVMDASDARELAAVALDGGLGALPTDGGPFEGIRRAWQAIEGTVFARPFAEQMAEGLNDSSRRGAALFFFGCAPKAPGGDTLMELARAGRSGEVTLQPAEINSALNALGQRVMAGDDAARGFLRQAALGPASPEPYIAALSYADPDWVIEHAVQIVEGHPEVGLPLIYNLQEAGRDPVPTGIAIAPIVKGSAAFRKNLPRFIDDHEPIRRAMKKRD